MINTAWVVVLHDPSKCSFLKSRFFVCFHLSILPDRVKQCKTPLSMVYVCKIVGSNFHRVSDSVMREEF